MQTMPIASCSQRKCLPSANGTGDACGVAVMIPPWVRFCFGLGRYRCGILVCDMPERKTLFRASCRSAATTSSLGSEPKAKKDPGKTGAFDREDVVRGPYLGKMTGCSLLQRPK